MDDSSVHLSCQHIIDAGYVVNEKTLVCKSDEIGPTKFTKAISLLREKFNHDSACVDKEFGFSMIIYNTSTKQVYLVWL